jgi:regulatory protein
MAKPLKDIAERLRHYCGFQERSEKEVETRMRTLEIDQDQWGQLLQMLKDEGFLDEQRFAQSFARGKFRINKWGKALIRQGLRQKGVSEDLIEQALHNEIDPEDYLETLRTLIGRRERPSDSASKAKIINALLRKGYEQEFIYQVMHEQA